MSGAEPCGSYQWLKMPFQGTLSQSLLNPLCDKRRPIHAAPACYPLIPALLTTPATSLYPSPSAAPSPPPVLLAASLATCALGIPGMSRTPPVAHAA